MTEEEFIEVSDKIRKVTGIHFPSTKKYFVESRLERRIKEIGEFKGIHSPIGYMDYISRNIDKDEIDHFYKMVTINETFFYRSVQQFDTVENILIPEIIENKKPFNNVKIWSAASSSGEEIYTMALIIEEKLSKLYPNISFNLEGSDLDPEVIQKALDGVYKTYAVRNIPSYVLQKYFQEKEGSYILDNSIKSRVRFKQANLAFPNTMVSFKGQDIVFLANVLIYFNQETKEKVLSNIYNLMSRGSYLLIGYSESLQGIKHDFESMTINKTIVYRKN